MKNISIKIPDWFRKNAVYQINPRTFSAEGTIKAVTEELQNLKDLGFNIIYLCPIFEADDSEDRTYWSIRQKASETNNPKNPYRMNDYFVIDEEYGTMEDLRELVETAHAKDMKVLLDLVYLHIGPNAPILKSHPEFAMQNEDGSFVTNYWNFITWDFNCQGLREYLWCNMTYYVGVIGVDGFRCDVGDGVPLDFWVEGRRRIKNINPDAILIDEGVKYSWMASGFDSCYNFGWHENIFKILIGKMTVKEAMDEENAKLAELPLNGMLLRDMDNHDTVTDWPDRVENIAGHDGMEMILALNYSFAGIPMVYCGNELADSAKLSMFANRFHMGKFEVTNRAEKKTEAALRRQSVIKKLNQMKRENEILFNGDTVWLNNTAPDSIVSFARVLGDKKVIFIGNLTNKETVCEISDIENYASANILLESKNAIAKDAKNFVFPPFGYMVFQV